MPDSEDSEGKGKTVSYLTTGCYTNGSPCRHGARETWAYVAEPAVARQQAAACEDFIVGRAWNVAETVIETEPYKPLEQREGWRRVQEALRDGRAEVVVVPSPSHLATDGRGFAAAQAEFRARHTVLVAVTGNPPNGTTHK